MIRKKVYLSKSKACDPQLATLVEDHLKDICQWAPIDLIQFSGGTWTKDHETQLKACDVAIFVGPKKNIKSDMDMHRFYVGKGQYDMFGMFNEAKYIVEGSDGCATGVRYIDAHYSSSLLSANYQDKYGYAQTSGSFDDTYDSDSSSLNTICLEDTIQDLFTWDEWQEIMKKKQEWEGEFDTIFDPVGGVIGYKVYNGTGTPIFNSSKHKGTITIVAAGRIVPMLAASLL